MSKLTPNIKIPVDLTNPGQFFACCGLLELADRLWPGAEGWFEGRAFCVDGKEPFSLESLMECALRYRIVNTMTSAQNDRLEWLLQMKKGKRGESPEFEEELKDLTSLRRELPIVLEGDHRFRVDWFCDKAAGGSRFKTWAGQQSVLDITRAMQSGLKQIYEQPTFSIWGTARNIGLPFNFDSDLGAQGSALDMGFSLDPLAASKLTRIDGCYRPAIELFCFIGLQRFRPRELLGENRLAYATWCKPLPASVAAVVACHAVAALCDAQYEFRLLYRTDYLKSFLPAQPFQGE